MTPPKKDSGPSIVARGVEITVSKVHTNLDQEAIITTDDKLRLCLHQYLGSLERRRDWIAPLGVFLSLALALATSTFTEKRLGLEKEVWQAIFVILSVVAFVWLLITFWNRKAAMSVDDLVRALKKEPPAGPVLDR